MKCTPMTNMKRESEKDRVINDLTIYIDGAMTAKDKEDYSQAVWSLSMAIIKANELADMKADE